MRNRWQRARQDVTLTLVRGTRHLAGAGAFRGQPQSFNWFVRRLSATCRSELIDSQSADNGGQDYSQPAGHRPAPQNTPPSRSYFGQFMRFGSGSSCLLVSQDPVRANWRVEGLRVLTRWRLCRHCSAQVASEQLRPSNHLKADNWPVYSSSISCINIIQSEQLLSAS